MPLPRSRDVKSRKVVEGRRGGVEEVGDVVVIDLLIKSSPEDDPIGRAHGVVGSLKNVPLELDDEGVVGVKREEEVEATESATLSKVASSISDDSDKDRPMEPRRKRGEPTRGRVVVLVDGDEGEIDAVE